MDQQGKTEGLTAGRDIIVGGIRTRIVDTGSGPPVVLIHGLGGPLMWQRVTPLLAARFRVIQIDLPGFGFSGPPPHPFTTAEYASHILGCCDLLTIGRTAVAGISYGGQIAATLAAAHPGRIEKLMLICSTGLMKEYAVTRHAPLWSVFALLVKNTILQSRRLMCWFGRRSFFDAAASRPADLCDRFYEQLSRPGARDAWMNAFRNTFSRKERFLTDLRSLAVPTLILWGECDITVSPSYAAGFQKAIAGSQVVRFPNCAHSVPLEKPKELVEVLERFFVGREEK